MQKSPVVAMQHRPIPALIPETVHQFPSHNVSFEDFRLRENLNILGSNFKQKVAWMNAGMRIGAFELVNQAGTIAEGKY